MPSLEIKGGEQFAAVARAFRQAEGELPRELVKALERSAKPLRKDAKASALEHLPSSGGLNHIVAGARMTVRRIANGVRIVAKGIDQLRLTNQGKIVHPTYGHRPRKLQPIPKAKDWFTRPLRDGEPKVRKELVKALDKIARRIA